MVRAAEALDPAALGELRRAAAALLEQGGRLEAAAELPIAAGDSQAFAAFVAGHAEQMVDQVRFHTLRTWLDALPAGDVGDSPWLLLWLGLCKAVARDATSRASLERSCALFDAAGDLVGSCAARGWRFQFARSAAELEELLPDEDSGATGTPRSGQGSAGRGADHPDLQRGLPPCPPGTRFGRSGSSGQTGWRAGCPRPRSGCAWRASRGSRTPHARGDITRLRSVIAAAEADLAGPGVSVRDRYVFLNVWSLEAFASGAFQAAE